MSGPNQAVDIGRIADALELLALEVSQIRALIEVGQADENEDIGQPLPTPIEAVREPKGN
jgi:hypothetical protein